MGGELRKNFPLFQLQDSSHSPNPHALAVCRALSGHVLNETARLVLTCPIALADK